MIVAMWKNETHDFVGKITSLTDEFSQNPQSTKSISRKVEMPIVGSLCVDSLPQNTQIGDFYTETRNQKKEKKEKKQKQKNIPRVSCE